MKDRSQTARLLTNGRKQKQVHQYRGVSEEEAWTRFDAEDANAADGKRTADDADLASEPSTKLSLRCAASVLTRMRDLADIWRPVYTVPPKSSLIQNYGVANGVICRVGQNEQNGFTCYTMLLHLLPRLMAVVHGAVGIAPRTSFSTETCLFLQPSVSTLTGTHRLLWHLAFDSLRQQCTVQTYPAVKSDARTSASQPKGKKMS